MRWVPGPLLNGSTPIFMQYRESLKGYQVRDRSGPDYLHKSVVLVNEISPKPA